MLKIIFLFGLMNISIIAMISITIFLIEIIFGISLSGYSGSMTNIFIYSLIVGFVGSFISLFLSKWMAKKTYNISIIDKDKDYYNLSIKEKLVYDLVEDLSRRENIKMPEVGFYGDNEINAFATGATKNNSLIAISEGLLNYMNNDEIEGVVAHEMAHITNGDMVTMTLLQGLLNTFVVFLSRIIANIFDSATYGRFGTLGYFVVYFVLQILIGLLATIIAMSFSRYREYKADYGSAKYVGKTKMIMALKKLELLSKNNVLYSDNEVNKNMETMKIFNFSNKGLMSLFSSHPQLNDRITKLENTNI